MQFYQGEEYYYKETGDIVVVDYIDESDYVVCTDGLQYLMSNLTTDPSEINESAFDACESEYESDEPNNELNEKIFQLDEQIRGLLSNQRGLSSTSSKWQDLDEQRFNLQDSRERLIDLMC